MWESDLKVFRLRMVLLLTTLIKFNEINQAETWKHISWKDKLKTRKTFWYPEYHMNALFGFNLIHVSIGSVSIADSEDDFI